METARKYDLIAISLLMFSVVIVTAMTFDPKGFSLKEWQPLMAALVALGSAGVVYRGARLAYQASMEKVDLDREIHLKEVRRRQRGIFLRTALVAHIMQYDANLFCGLMKGPKTRDEPPITMEPATIVLRTVTAFDEAWSNLDAFPKSVAEDISRLKTHLYNIEDALHRLGPAQFEIPFEPSLTGSQKLLDEALNFVARYSLRIRDALHVTEKEDP